MNPFNAYAENMIERVSSHIVSSEPVTITIHKKEHIVSRARRTLKIIEGIKHERRLLAAGDFRHNVAKLYLLWAHFDREMEVRKS